LPRCHRVLTSEKPRERGYPKEPRTLGEHLKRRRLDLGLRQCDVAAAIGVTAQTVRHWESGKHSPPVRLIPRIHAFLGFCPFDPAWTFGPRLRAAREAQGLSRRRASALVGVDEATVARAEWGVPGMARRSLLAVARLLQCDLPSLDQGEHGRPDVLQRIGNSGDQRGGGA
jgi:transcriptional regulator with XRE-family HTH domain